MIQAIEIAYVITGLIYTITGLIYAKFISRRMLHKDGWMLNIIRFIGNAYFWLPIVIAKMLFKIDVTDGEV